MICIDPGGVGDSGCDPSGVVDRMMTGIPGSLDATGANG